MKAGQVFSSLEELEKELGSRFGVDGFPNHFIEPLNVFPNISGWKPKMYHPKYPKEFNWYNTFEGVDDWGSFSMEEKVDLITSPSGDIIHEKYKDPVYRNRLSHFEYAKEFHNFKRVVVLNLKEEIHCFLGVYELNIEVSKKANHCVWKRISREFNELYVIKGVVSKINPLSKTFLIKGVDDFRTGVFGNSKEFVNLYKNKDKKILSLSDTKEVSYKAVDSVGESLIAQSIAENKAFLFEVCFGSNDDLIFKSVSTEQ